MSVLDYQTLVDGEPYDPVPVGGSVSSLKLYDDAARTDLAHTITAVAALSAGVYRFTVDDAAVPAGRYWARVTWTKVAAGPPVLDDLLFPVDLPIVPDMILSPEALAVYLGIALPITAEQRAVLVDAIRDAQADVEGYLGRAVTPRLVAERRCWPAVSSDLALTGWTLREQPVIALVSEVEEFDGDFQTGYWTVTYWAGLDARTDPELRPIRRLALAQAATQPNAEALWRSVGSGALVGVGKRVKSLSAEGQAVSYEHLNAVGGSTSNAGTVGGPPTWASIDRWRVAGRRVVQRRGYTLI